MSERPPTQNKSPAAPPVERPASVESVEKPSPRLLQGSFYLTKIAHELLPHFVPDIDEPAEGQQTFTREGVAYHVPPNDGDYVDPAQEAPGTGSEINAISNKLEVFGLTSRVDVYHQSYVGEGKGNVRYIKTLMPWEVVDSVPKTLDLVFDPKEVRTSIRRSKALSPEAKQTCEGYLDTILKLFEEERAEREKTRLENLRDSAEGIKEIEDILAGYESPEVFKVLLAIMTEEEAEQNELRKVGVAIRTSIGEKVALLKAQTNITQEQLAALNARCRPLFLALGVRGRGKVDHMRI